MRFCGRIVAAAALVASAAGCQQSSTAPVAPKAQSADASLNELAQLFQAFAQEKKRPPKDMADLASITPEPPAATLGIQEGKIVVLWGGSYVTGSAGSVILAHETAAPTKGGYVLLQDGTVKKMTAAEFQSAPKAK
jgi:hypothetical protein